MVDYEFVKTAIMAPLIYEVCRYVILALYDRSSSLKEKPFGINGYWVAWHDAEEDQELFQTLEMILISAKRHHVKVKIYHLVNRSEKSVYIGTGCYKKDLLTIVYQEASNINSCQSGALMLKVFESSNHESCLDGYFVERVLNEKNIYVTPYRMEKIEFDSLDKIKFFFKRSSFMFKYLSNNWEILRK